MYGHDILNIRTCSILITLFYCQRNRGSMDWLLSHVFGQFCFSVFLLVMIGKDCRHFALVWLRRSSSFRPSFYGRVFFTMSGDAAMLPGLSDVGKDEHSTHMFNTIDYVFFLRMPQLLMAVWAYLLPWFLHVPFTLLDMLCQNNPCFNGNVLANPNSTTTLWLETGLWDSRTQDLLDGWWDLAEGLEPKFWGQGPRCGFHAIPAIAHGLDAEVSKLWR